MDCREFEHKIPSFIKRKMNYVTMKQFLAHLESCENCREELTIQFLIHEGLSRLEQGNAFDLQRELDGRMEEARRKVRVHEDFLHAGELAQILVIVGTAAFLVWIIG